MALTPVVFNSFTGLNLADDPLDVGGGGTTSCLNVDFRSDGLLRSRAGTTNLLALTSITSADGLAPFETSSGTSQFVIGYTAAAAHKFAAYASTGGAAIATATPASAQIYAVRCGSPTTQYLYIANGPDTIWRWDGAAFTQPAGMPAALYLTLAPGSNRLVAGFTGGGGSMVQFSDAPTSAAPLAVESWPANNFVYLTPGDESNLQGLATWQNLIFAFKKRRFFVFTSESEDTAGNPEFNYRAVDGYGAIVPPVAGDEGVYFFDGRMVWLTNGGIPKRVSRVVEPYLQGLKAANFGTVVQSTLSSTRMSYSLGRLYMTLGENTGSRAVLVYDPKVDQWSYYGLGFTFASTLGGAQAPYTIWLSSDSLGNLTVGKFDPLVATDNGNPYTWLWKSGFFQPAKGQRIVMREQTIYGSAALTNAWTTQVNVIGARPNDIADTGTAGLPILGTVGPVTRRRSVRGIYFQHSLTGGNGGSLVSQVIDKFRGMEEDPT